MAAEGTEIGKAYITVNLDDETDADYEKLKAKYDKKTVKIGTSLADPNSADLDRIKAKLAAGRGVSIPVNLDTKQADQAAASTDQNFTSHTAKMAAAWSSLGALVAGPAVALGLGVVAGGIAAIGIAAEKSNPEVQKAFDTFKSSGLNTLQQSFQSLTPVIVGSVNQWTTAVGGLGPEFTRISEEIGPGMAIVNDAFVKGAQTVVPAFATALGGATPNAHALAGAIGDISSGFANFFTHLDFSQADSGLTSLGRDVGQLESTLATALNAVIPLSNALLSGVVPAVISTASHLSTDLAPALTSIGSIVTGLGPLLNFMAGPTASVLVGVAAFKLLQSTTNALLPAFNAVSTKMSELDNATGGTSSAFTLMTNAQKQAAVQAAALSLAAAHDTAQITANRLAVLEAAASDDVNSVSQQALTDARVAATAAAAAEAEATTALATATEASSFAFGPVGIGLAALAGLMTLFAGTTKSDATPAVQNLTQQLNQLASAAPGAAAGMLQTNPKLAELVNRAASAGLSVGELNTALEQGGVAQQQVQGKLNGTIAALGQQKTAFNEASQGGKEGGETYKQTSISIADLSARIGDNAQAMAALSPQQQQQVQKYRDLQGALSDLDGMFSQNAAAQQAAGNVAASSVELTADQYNVASHIAGQFGMNVDDVVNKMLLIPGAGEAGAAGVQKLSSAFLTGTFAVADGEQKIQDYFTQLQQNAEQASNGVSTASHSYQQAIASVADAQHSYVQAQAAVKQADDQVAAAKRAVTDATNAYGQAEHSVTQAQQSMVDAENGVTTAEENLTKAQVAERQAQQALTDARQAAAEQLKSLNLQLNDQIAAENRAQLKLFEQTQTASLSGINPGNISDILAQPTTTANESMKQSALDLLDAENSLADTLNTGVGLRQQVTKANQQGVDGNPQVVSAAQALQNAQEQVASAEIGVQKAHQAVSDAVYSLQQAYYNLQKAQQGIVDANANVVKAEQGVTDAVYNEQKARAAIKDAIFNEHQALISLKTAQDAARQASDLNTHSLDLSTQAGRNNYQQLLTLFNAYPAWITGTDRYNQMVNDTATAFHTSKDWAFNFLQQEGQIPKDFKFSTTGVVQVDTSPLTAFTDGYFKGGFRTSGGQIGFAQGGPISGPGGPTDDKIPLWGSDGEYMQPASSVDFYGHGFMEAVRQRKLPKFATGGLVSNNLFGTVAGAGYIANVDALTAGGFPHPAQIPAYVAPPTPQFSGGSFSGGVTQWTPEVVQALGMLGQSPGLVPNVLRRMQQESGGNPTIVNTWDSNAARGTPSVGLMQVIGPTFRSNAGPLLGVGPYEYGVSVNPLANIYSGLHYAIGRYPSLQYAMDKPGGYDSGGYMLNKPGVNTTGKPEMILPPGLTQTVEGINKAYHEQGRTGSAPAEVHNHYTNNINVTTIPTDPYQTATAVSDEVMWQLRAR